MEQGGVAAIVGRQPLQGGGVYGRGGGSVVAEAGFLAV